jgi:chromosome segregation ATPase
MNRITAFFGRTGTSGNSETSNAAAPQAAAANLSPIDEVALENLGSRIGAENEGLRGMLIEASRKFEELDSLKAAFGNIVTPVGDMLREVEQEKSQNASLRNLLAEVRTALDALRTEHAQTEKERASFKQDNALLRQDLGTLQQDVQALDSLRAKLTDEVAAHQGQVAQLERQLGIETAQRQALSDAHDKLADEIQASDKKIVRLEADIQALQEKLLLTEQEKQSVQASLDQSIAEVSRVSRRLSETENLLAGSRSRISDLETTVAHGEAERNALQLRFDEAGEQHQTEAAALSNKLNAMQSRATASEKLLVEVRQTLAARTEEAREWERKASEAETVRIGAEKKLRQVEAANEALEHQVSELTQSRATLVERSGVMTKTLKQREAALARAEEQNAALAERVKQLEADHQVLREAEEKRVEELNSALSRERMARAVAEGALSSSRRDFARVQQEIADINLHRTSKTATQTPATLAKRVRSNLSKPGTVGGAEPSPAPAAAPKGRNGKKPADDHIAKN